MILNPHFSPVLPQVLGLMTCTMCPALSVSFETGSHCMTHAGIEIIILLLQSLEFRDYSCAPVSGHIWQTDRAERNQASNTGGSRWSHTSIYCHWEDMSHMSMPILPAHFTNPPLM